MPCTNATKNKDSAVLGMSPVDIKVALLRRGVTQKEIADHLGITKVTVSQVVNGRVRSRRVENYIKQVLIGDAAA